jgi:hypothetical protein
MQNSVSFQEIAHTEINTSESEPSVLLLTRFLRVHDDETYYVDREFIFFFFKIWGPHLRRSVSFTNINFSEFLYYIFPPLLF